MREIIDFQNIKEYNSNILVKAKVDNKLDVNKKDIYIIWKIIPLLDPIHYLLNNYNVSNPRNFLLPSNYNFNTFTKINDMNNMAYIDVFFSFLVSKLTESDKNPSFPIYYGSVNGLGSYKHDISDDIDEFKNHSGFLKMCKKIDIEEFTSGGSRHSSSCSSMNSGYSNSTSSYEDDYIATFKNFPVIYLFIESLEGTLEDIIQKEMNLDLLKSCLFQITFALIYLQKHYYFTHNDLHINNIMYQSTDRPYLYYKYNNQYYKVPTYGKIFKIIDFGRSIFTFRKKTYMNDTSFQSMVKLKDNIPTHPR